MNTIILLLIFFGGLLIGGALVYIFLANAMPRLPW